MEAFRKKGGLILSSQAGPLPRKFLNQWKKAKDTTITGLRSSHWYRVRDFPGVSGGPGRSSATSAGLSVFTLDHACYGSCVGDLDREGPCEDEGEI